jgi:putative endonuclease
MAYYVYLLASKKHGTLYLGVTSDLVRRGHEHRTKAIDGFTSRYGVNKLVWFEIYDDAITAIAREKELKKWRRDWKIRLIEEENPGWVDLYPGISNWHWEYGFRACAKMAHPGMTKGNSRELFPDSIVKQPCTVIASEAKQSMEPQERLDCFVASLLAMTSKHTPAFPRRDAPELLRRRALEKQRAQGMPDARRVRSRVRSGRKHTR